MNEQFYTILTNLGLAAFANAPVLNKQVIFSKIAVGDGNGSYYTPTKDMTNLRNKVWEGNISSVSIDENNANWVIVETIIPADVGGFTIREVGIYDDENNLLGIGKMPETFKPQLAQGSSKDLYIKVIFEVTNATSVTLKNDPSVIIATKKYVDDLIVTKVTPVQQNITQIQQSIYNLQQTFTEHLADLVKHGVYGIATGTNALTMTLVNVTSYPVGMLVAFKNTTANTGAVTLNINGIGDKSIKKANGNDLSSGNLKAGGVYQCRYDGSNFFLLGEGGEYGTATANDVRLGKTFGTENDVLNGALDLSKLIPTNIREGITIDGILGNLKEQKKASGTVTATSTTSNFLSSRDISVPLPTITVSGLDFTPSVVIAEFYLHDSTHSTTIWLPEEIVLGDGISQAMFKFRIIIEKNNGRELSGGFRQAPTSYHLKGEGAASVSAGGFTLPVTELTKGYKWYAYK